MKETKSITLRKSIIKSIEGKATEENRSFSNMIEVMVDHYLKEHPLISEEAKCCLNKEAEFEFYAEDEPFGGEWIPVEFERIKDPSQIDDLIAEGKLRRRKV